MELSILHLAMSEIAVLGTRHQIVINEVFLEVVITPYCVSELTFHFNSELLWPFREGC